MSMGGEYGASAARGFRRKTGGGGDGLGAR